MKKLIFIPLLLAPAAIALASLAVMLLWNVALVPIVHIGTVTFLHAVGIFLLARLLFGKVGRGGHMGRFFWKKKMFGKWQNMTAEEKELFRSNMQGQGRHYCGC